jgi:insulin receptor
VCASLDIRNDPALLEKLRGCRVIEGFLQILLFDRYNESMYTNITFPELREITGYLLMYRVIGLRTLSQLFPNLAVIRGQRLFNDYALILYEMMTMRVR